MSDLWIVIPNWDKFQHYKDRTPPWIKLYLELNSDNQWLSLTDAQCGLLVKIWIEYARSRGVLPVARLVLRPDNRYANVMRALDSLQEAGFLEIVASKPLALRSRSPKEREEKNHPLPLPQTRKGIAS